MMLLMVLLRVLTNTSSNVVQKQLTNKSRDPVLVILVAYGIMVVLGSPVALLTHQPASSSFWNSTFIAAMLDAVGYIFLMLSIRSTDLSIFGPLNAFKVVISMALSFVMLREIPTHYGVLGVLAILSGSYLLAPSGSLKQGQMVSTLFKQRGVWYRILSLTMFSLGTVYLKKSATTGSLFTAFYWWAVFGLVLFVAWFPLWCKMCGNNPWKLFREILPDYRSCILLALLIAPMQLATLWTFRHTLIGYALALFQVGMILQVFAGHLFFQERDIKRRLLAAVIMLIGAMIIICQGG